MGGVGGGVRIEEVAFLVGVESAFEGNEPRCSMLSLLKEGSGDDAGGVGGGVCAVSLVES